MQNDINSKSKIGRSKFEPDYLMDFVTGLYPDIKTRKGRQNKCYETHTLRVIWKREDVGDVNFLFDPTKEVLQSSILGRLGRLLNKEGIRMVVKGLCSMAKTEKHIVREWKRICYNPSIQYFCKLLDYN